MTAQVDSSAATVSPESMQSHGDARRGRWWRRTAVAIVASFLFAGVLNMWGPRQGIIRADGEHHQITVSSPSVSRGGLAASWQVTVRRHDGGTLPQDVEVALDAAYLSLFDQHALEPPPTEAWTDGGVVHWRFRLPSEVRELTVTLDARIQPDRRWRHRGTTVVRVGGDTITARPTTWLLP